MSPQPRPAAEPQAMIALNTVSSDVPFVIARVDRSGVHEIGRGAFADSFAWIDPHTLVAIQFERRTTVARRFVDGALTDTAELPVEFGRLMITSSREAWVSNCDPTELSFDGKTHRPSGDCGGGYEYWRVFPSPRVTKRVAPHGIIPYGAAVGMYDQTRRWSRVPPPERPAPAGVRLSSATVDTGSRKVAGVACERGAERSVVPSADWAAHFDGQPFAILSARWVVEQPPIYEVVMSYGHEVASRSPSYRFYYHACQSEPFEHIAVLEASLWAAWAEHPEGGPDHLSQGTWTFWNGTEPIGTLAGYNNLRASVR
jgi:hypothetical protein